MPTPTSRATQRIRSTTRWAAARPPSRSRRPSRARDGPERTWHPRHVRSLVLVANPFATRVTPEKLAEVEQALARAADVRVVETAHPRHATELVRDACSGGCDAVVVFSGDGGFNEALNGLAADVPIGFLPGGGTSVLSRALGLPAEPVAAATQIAEALEENRTRRITLGRVNGRRFAFSAGIGVDAEA